MADVAGRGDPAGRGGQGRLDAPPGQAPRGRARARRWRYLGVVGAADLRLDQIRLPPRSREDADGELLAAASNRAGLTELALLAEELRRVPARPDADGDGFEDRQVRLSTTFEGAGRLTGDLTPRCAAALEAVLGALARPKAGPEDTPTPWSSGFMTRWRMSSSG